MFSLTDSELPRERKAYLEQMLQSGETLLWAGQPVSRSPLMVLLGSMLIVIVAAMLTVGELSAGIDTALWTAVRSGNEIEMAIFGAFAAIPVLIALVALLYPLAYRYRLQQTVYAVTDRRYLSACRYPLIGFLAKEWTGKPLALTTEKDGSGDIVMEYREVSTRQGGVTHMPLGLLHVPHIALVAELIGQGSTPLTADALTEPAPAPPSSKKLPPWLSVLCLLLAPCAWGGAWLCAEDTYATMSACVETPGLVTYVEQEHTADSQGVQHAYKAHFCYKAEGQIYHSKERVATNPARYKVGDRLTVLYNPADPQEAYTDSPFEQYAGALILAALGAVLAVVGAFSLFFGRRPAR